jgi:hypothetical protein
MIQSIAMIDFKICHNVAQFINNVLWGTLNHDTQEIAIFY